MFLDVLGVLNVQVLGQRRVAGLLVVGGRDALDRLTRLLHGASTGIGGNIVLLDTFYEVFALCSTLLAVRSVAQQRSSDSVNQHWLSVQLHLKRSPFLDDPIDPLTEVLGLEVCPSYWALVLLASILISINALVVIEVDVLLCIGLLLLLLTMLADLVLVLFVVRQLVQIVVVWVLLPRSGRSLIMHFSVHSSLLHTLVLLLVHSSVHVSYLNSNVKTNIFKKLIVIN